MPADVAPGGAQGNGPDRTGIVARHGQGLQISEVILQMSIETRGAEHTELTLDTLRQAGYDPMVVPD